MSVKNKKGNTPLLEAVYLQRISFIAYFLSLGADP